MSLTSWLRNLGSSVLSRQIKLHQRPRGSRFAAFPPGFETLENRLALSVTWVSDYTEIPPGIVMMPEPPAFSDFTSDGIPDMISSDGYFVRVDPGLVDGTFGPPIFTEVPYAYDLSVADFNGDGRCDVITAGNGGTVSDYVDTVFSSVLLGKGDGTFNVYESSQNCCFFLSAIGSGDIDGDNDPDVAFLGLGWDSEQVVLVGHNDGDWRPHVSVSGGNVTEGNAGATDAVFGLYLDFAFDVDVTVQFDTADGSALAGSDYVATSGTVTIPAGQTSATFSVRTTGDRVPEPNETFLVRLSNATNAQIGTSAGTATIVDDEPRVSISDVTKTEGKRNGTTLFTFTVSLSAAYDRSVTMSFKTVDGTAKASDGDYVGKTGTLTFAPGETTKTITIEVKGDSKKESDETFYLDLFGLSSNSLFTRNRGIGKILNDD